MSFKQWSAAVIYSPGHWQDREAAKTAVPAEISLDDASRLAEKAFKVVVSNAANIELDHYIVYRARKFLTPHRRGGQVY